MNGEMLTTQVSKGKHIPIKLYTFLDASKIRAQLKTTEAQGLADEIMAYYPKRESYLLPERWHFRGPEDMPSGIRKQLIRKINKLGTKRGGAQELFIEPPPTGGVGSLGLIPPPIK